MKKKYNWAKISLFCASIAIIEILITTIFEEELKAYSFYQYWQLLSFVFFLFTVFAFLLSYRNKKK